MNTHNLNPSSAGFTRREGLLALIGGAAALAGCGGGGGGSASVGSGGTGSFSSGTITGFGSIIVNGVRFDDSQARISDDDGSTRSSGDLKLGMVATISGSAITAGAAGTTPTATATSISFGSELKGPIDSKGTDSFVVLGQTVKIMTSTLFGLGITGGLTGLTVGQLVEVHGYLDPATNTLTATLIEKQDNANEYKLQGLVKTLNMATMTFNIGPLTISYGNILTTDLPANLANELLVRVRLATSPATGTRTATRVRNVQPRVEDRNEAEIEGRVTAFTSTSSFSVNGVPVTSTSQTSFPDGTAGLILGAQVEVKGSTSNGVLIATRVSLETETEINQLEFELHGTVSALNTTAKTFVVRGVTVKYTDTVRVDNGSLSQLADGRLVEVRGTNDTASASLLATRIKFES